MFTVSYDATNGIIRCASGGFITVDEVSRSSSAVQDFLRRSRREFGSAAMLVIGVDTVVQSPEVMEAANSNMRKLYPNDRVASVVSSHLAKMQADRTLTSDCFKVFTSESEARTWLATGRAALRTAAA